MENKEFNENPIELILKQNKVNLFQNSIENVELVLTLLQNSQIFSTIVSKNPILTRYFSNSMENLQKKNNPPPILKKQNDNCNTPFKRAATHVAIAYFVYIKSVFFFKKIQKFLEYK